MEMVGFVMGGELFPGGNEEKLACCGPQEMDDSDREPKAGLADGQPDGCAIGLMPHDRLACCDDAEERGRAGQRLYHSKTGPIEGTAERGVAEKAQVSRWFETAPVASIDAMSDTLHIRRLQPKLPTRFQQAVDIRQDLHRLVDMFDDMADGDDIEKLRLIIEDVESTLMDVKAHDTRVGSRLRIGFDPCHLPAAGLGDLQKGPVRTADIQDPSAARNPSPEMTVFVFQPIADRQDPMQQGADAGGRRFAGGKPPIGIPVDQTPAPLTQCVDLAIRGLDCGSMMRVIAFVGMRNGIPSRPRVEIGTATGATLP